MSGKFGLASGKCQGILFCQVCMNPACPLKEYAIKNISELYVNMTPSSNSSQSTRPTGRGRVLWEELLVLSRFHS